MDLSAIVAIKKLLKHSIQATQSSRVNTTFIPDSLNLPTPPPNKTRFLHTVGGHFKTDITDICTHLKTINKSLFTVRFWLDGKLGKHGRIKWLIKQEFIRIKGKASKNDKQKEKAS